MKNPLWILNSALALISVGVLLLLFFLPSRVAQRLSLVPKKIEGPAPKDVSKINIARIYESDLFDTYFKPSAPVQEKKISIQLPPAPAPKPSQPYKKPKPQFLEPLPIILKGIIFTNDNNHNRAIIAHSKTKQENLYSVGAVIEDAELVFIGKNKVIFIRSNGQKETLFISEAEAQRDPAYLQRTSWEIVANKISDNYYSINLEELSKRVTNLASFLDLLDITSAFENGKTIGCRIGSIKKSSLGASLGLQEGDIILSINDHPTNSTNDRVVIYKELKKAAPGASVATKIKRNGRVLSLTYVIEGLPENTTQSSAASLEKPFIPSSPERSKSENYARSYINTKEESPMAYKIKRNDKNNMLQKSGKNAALKRLPS